MSCGGHKKDCSREKEPRATAAPFCLDCVWCEPVVALYGGTSYRCVKTDQVMGSAAALVEYCGRFQH